MGLVPVGDSLGTVSLWDRGTCKAYGFVNSLYLRMAMLVLDFLLVLDAMAFCIAVLAAAIAHSLDMLQEGCVCGLAAVSAALAGILLLLLKYGLCS